MIAPLLVLDEGLPEPLAGELRARGREARSVAELGLRGANDADVLAAIARGAVLVTTDDRLAARRGPVAVAVVDRAPDGVRLDRWRRDVVHRWATAMEAQAPGTARRYGSTGRRPSGSGPGRSPATGR